MAIKRCECCDAVCGAKQDQCDTCQYLDCVGMVEACKVWMQTYVHFSLEGVTLSWLRRRGRNRGYSRKHVDGAVREIFGDVA